MAKVLLKNHPVHCLVTDYCFSFALRKAKKPFSSKAPNQLSEAAQKKDNTTTVKTRNLFSKVRIKPSILQLLRSSPFPKRKTKKHSFFNLLRKRNSPKRKNQKHSFFKQYSFCFFGVSEAVALNFLPFVTPS